MTSQISGICFFILSLSLEAVHRTMIQSVINVFIESTVKEDIRYVCTNIIPYRNMLTTFSIIQAKKLLVQSPAWQFPVKKGKNLSI